MNNFFQTYGDISKIIHDWIKVKYKEKFNQDIDLSKEIIITYSDKIHIILTPTTSEIDEESLIYLTSLVNYLHTDLLTLEEMKDHIKNYLL